MNLNTRQLEVYRDPLPMPGSPFGYGYRSITLYAEQDAVAPLAAPESSVAVADRMPPFKAASSSSAETRKRTRKK